MVNTCFEERTQELNRKFGNICISPRPQASLRARAPLHAVKELEHQSRQNICTLNFLTVLNQIISECNSIMDCCQDSIKSTLNRAKHQIQKAVNPERVIKIPMTRPEIIWISGTRVSRFNRGHWHAKARS